MEVREGCWRHGSCWVVSNGVLFSGFAIGVCGKVEAGTGSVTEGGGTSEQAAKRVRGDSWIRHFALMGFSFGLFFWVIFAIDDKFCFFFGSFI